jgi:hypothetical protein
MRNHGLQQAVQVIITGVIELSKCLEAFAQVAGQGRWVIVP